MKKNYFLLFLLLLGIFPTAALSAQEKVKNNLVCFVRFVDEEPADVFKDNPFSFYDNLFNDASPNANSVYNYYKQASYGQMVWKSSFYPLPKDGKIVSYRAEYERGYYQKYNSLNEIGYKNAQEGMAREQALMKEIARYLSNNLPDDISLDADNDGIVDNLCVVFSGISDINSNCMLWPHRSDLALPDEKAIYVKGKKLVGYLLVFDESNGFGQKFDYLPLNTGVLCHEMSHSLGTYDLYHETHELNPVGIWDLLSDLQPKAQNMLVYTKYRYCKWINDIPTISKPGRYTLNPVGGKTKENIAYKIQPVGSNEYFMVEYRKKEGFDASLPESGLLVYRIAPQFPGGNIGYNGTTRLDETYIFRPGGTTKDDGDLSKAAFSAESGRTAFGGSAERKPFYSDGKVANFAIANVSACGETISFDLLPVEKQILLSADEVELSGLSGGSSPVTVSSDDDWTLSGVPEWLSVNKTEGVSGKEDLVFTTTTQNEGAKARVATITVTSKRDGSLRKQIVVSQLSSVNTSPVDLTAVRVGNAVKLQWKDGTKASTVFYDDFENVETANQWTIQNSDKRGWKRQEKTKYYKAYDGNYTMTLWSAWDDGIEDQYLTSPKISNGRKLEFYSRTNAANQTPKNNPQFYEIDVTSDGGRTWHTIFDATKNYPLAEDGTSLSGKYTLLKLDLSPYTSEDMRIRFHCRSTTVDGLSYYWSIDNFTVRSGEVEDRPTSYNVYRNGELLQSNVTLTEFTDEHPLEGENVYAVSAINSVGEGSPSTPVKVAHATGIDTLETFPVSSITGVFTIDGVKVSNKIENLGKGVYLVRYASGGLSRTKKIVIK